MKRIIRNKHNTATISLPKKSQGKAKPKAAARTSAVKKKTVSVAKRTASKTTTARRTGKKLSSATATAKVRPGTSGKKSKTKTAPKAEFIITNTERILFIIVLLVFLAVSSTYAYSKFKTRDMRFSMTKLIQEQVSLAKEKEKLNQEITTYKRPELILRRAKQNNMVVPDNRDVLALD